MDIEHRYFERATRRACWAYVRSQSRLARWDLVSGVIGAGVGAAVAAAMNGTEVLIALLAGIVGAFASYTARMGYHLWVSPAVVARRSHNDLQKKYQDRVAQCDDLLARQQDLLAAQTDVESEQDREARAFQMSEQWQGRVNHVWDAFTDVFHRWRQSDAGREAGFDNFNALVRAAPWPFNTETGEPAPKGEYGPLLAICRGAVPPLTDSGTLSEKYSKDRWLEVKALQPIKRELVGVARRLHETPALDSAIYRELRASTKTIKILFYVQLALLHRTEPDEGPGDGFSDLIHLVGHLNDANRCYEDL